MPKLPERLMPLPPNGYFPAPARWAIRQYVTPILRVTCPIRAPLLGSWLGHRAAAPVNRAGQ